jgi:hypothetical protein
MGVVKAAQDEASPTPLPGESPEAKNLLLGEGQSLLRAHLTKAQYLAAATRAMDVHRLQQLVESSPNALRTRPTTA